MLNTASNIKNTLVHEYQHIKDGGNLTEGSAERRAIQVQKHHPTYIDTSSEYKLNIQTNEAYYKNK